MERTRFTIPLGKEFVVTTNIFEGQLIFKCKEDESGDLIKIGTLLKSDGSFKTEPNMPVILHDLKDGLYNIYAKLKENT